MIDLKNIEALFFNVLSDLKEYLNDLTLVGGWMPYVYSKFLWNKYVMMPVTTADVDFGFGCDRLRAYPKTIFEKLSSLDYTERHPQMDRIYPVVLCKGGRVPIDFITFPDVKKDIIKKLIGRQVNINIIENFNFLLEHRILVEIKNRAAYKVHCPKPSAFLYHKAATFIDRENEQGKAKDLYYAYFILRYAPDLDVILNEVNQYEQDGYFKDVLRNLDRYFKSKSSDGCLMVEKESGPDEYFEDLRQDIFERFSRLKIKLK